MHVYKLEFKNRSDIGTNYVPPAFVAVFALQLILWYKVYYMHSFSDAWSASYTTVHPKEGKKPKDPYISNLLHWLQIIPAVQSLLYWA